MTVIFYMESLCKYTIFLSGIIKNSTFNLMLLDNERLIVRNDNISTEIPRYIEFVPVGIYLLRSNDRDNFKFEVYSNSNNAITICIYVSSTYIRHLCDNYLIAPSIFKYVSNTRADSNDPIAIDIDIPISPIIKEPLLYMLPKLLLKPYQYQINNINWMISVEKMPVFKFEYLKIKHVLHNNDYYIDPVSNILYDKISLWNDKNKVETMNFKGGVICDEVGLGKTFSVVCLVASDKQYTQPKQKIVVRKVTSISKVNSTLVVCPRRLVGQWKSEIHKYVGTSSLKVLEISTMAHVKKYMHNIEDLDVDIVISSYSLLSNKNYHAFKGKKLNSFNWKRLIIDEGHEVLVSDIKKVGPKSIRDSILDLQALNKWVVSGTPLSNGVDSLNGILSFLTGNKIIVNHTDNLSQNNVNKLVSILFKRHDKESIKQEVVIPPVKMQVKMLDFTATEREIYNSCTDQTRQLKLCTNIMVSEIDSKIIGGNPISINQINQAMSSHHEAHAKISNNIINNYESEISELEDELSNNIPADEKSKIKAKINYRYDQIEKHSELILFHNSKVSLFTSFNIQSVLHKKCIITGTILKNCNKIAITTSGMVYSSEGINLLFTNKKTINCPVTRKTLYLSDITFIDPNKQTSQQSELVNKWGTKMGCMIETLFAVFKENKNNQIIIFSQWTKMLDLVSVVLNDSCIKHVFCKGNVHMMSKSISKFKTDPSYKVILLSSENCSSGSNLTEASHIFLLDSMNSDRDNAIAIEEQAIARSVRLGQVNSVIVTKFIMRNTIEEIYHNANKLATSN